MKYEYYINKGYPISAINKINFNKRDHYKKKVKNNAKVVGFVALAPITIPLLLYSFKGAPIGR